MVFGTKKECDPEGHGVTTISAPEETRIASAQALGVAALLRKVAETGVVLKGGGGGGGGGGGKKYIGEVSGWGGGGGGGKGGGGGVGENGGQPPFWGGGGLFGWGGPGVGETRTPPVFFLCLLWGGVGPGGWVSLGGSVSFVNWGGLKGRRLSSWGYFPPPVQGEA